MTLLMAWTDPRCGNWGSDWLLGDLKSCGENRCDSFWLANMATSTLEVSLTNTGTNVKQTYTTIRFTSQKHTQKRRNPNSQNGDAINKKCGFDTHTQTCWSRQDNRKFYLTDYSLEHILYIYMYNIYLLICVCMCVSMCTDKVDHHTHTHKQTCACIYIYNCRYIHVYV